MLTTRAQRCVCSGSRAQASKGTILMHGGFDGYYEQITTIAAALQDNGHEVLLFEGPGQGLVLDSLPMTHEWERPVAAVLDAYNVESCTILGMSLGGYLALRAAAFEPRITRLVCWDVCTTRSTPCSTTPTSPHLSAVLMTG